MVGAAMAFYTSDDSVNAIVADLGSYATKIGFAGEDYPRSYFRSNVGVLREDSDAATQGTKNDGTEQNKSNRRRRPRIAKVNYDTLNRPAAGDTDRDWEVANPVDITTGLWYDHDTNNNTHNNEGADWADLIPTFLRHGYDSALGLRSTSVSPLLMIERSYNPPPIRQQLLEILMEECQVPATFLGRDATMACYACGRTTSTVIDIGFSGTTVSPVFEGFVEQKAIRRAPVGTMAMDEMALAQLQAIVKSSSKKSSSSSLKPYYQVRNPKAQRKDAFRRLSLLQIGMDCRESGAGQAINAAASKTLQVPSMSYCLPDGETVDVPSQTRFAVANLVVGRAPEEDEPKPREEYYAKMKKEYESIIQAALEETSSETGDDAMEEENSAEEEDRKEQASKYTEATAVGISSSRRGIKHGKKASGSKSSKGKSEKSSEPALEPRVHFDNRILQKACAPYLETLLEQLTASPVANMVCDAAFRCDREQQAGVLGNVVLAGGGTCIGPTDQSVPDTLREQIETIIHAHTPGWRVKVLTPGMQERAIASWLGGSILGSLGSFHDMWISKAEYEEWGSAIVNRKCP